jgi:hypothetical protein
VNNYFFISRDYEYSSSNELIGKIVQDNWVDKDTIIVNCFPEYSSSLTQLINHKLSFLNKDELFETIDLQIPYPIGTQIWNPIDKEYQLFDTYITKWVKTHLRKNQKYLFVTSSVGDSRAYNKALHIIKSMLEMEDYRFATLFTRDTFKPDYFIKEVDKELGILFYWENSNNPNWNLKKSKP